MSLLTKYPTSNFALLLEDMYNLASPPKSPYSSRSKFIKLNETKGKLEVELAGYNTSEIEVYNEENILYVTANKKDGSRKYSHSWSISNEEKVDLVKYENGLLSIEISVIEPEKPKRTFYKIT